MMIFARVFKAIPWNFIYLRPQRTEIKSKLNPFGRLTASTEKAKGLRTINMSPAE